MRRDNPLRGWTVDRASLRHVGHGLQRPECVLAERDGTLWAADARGGVMRIAADGSQRLVLPAADTAASPLPPPASARLPGEPPRPMARVAAAPAAGDFHARYVRSQGSLPNGMAFLPGGDLIIANWGTDSVDVMTREGRLRRLFDRIEGRPLGKANFVLRDSRGRTWLTVTTRMDPWTDSINARAADGYIALIDEHGVRIVAEGFEGTNEVRLDAAEEWLYVVESNARRISRLRVAGDGSLSGREVYGPGRLGGFPDGFAFDAFGNLWVTLVMADRLVAITPEGEVLTLLDDGKPAAVAALDRHYEARTLTPEIMAAAAGTLAPWMASITFGGPDLRTVYIGSLRGTTLPCFRSPVAGLPPAHWNDPFIPHVEDDRRQA